MKFNLKFILGITLVSAMGGLLFGYDVVVIGGAKPFYERVLNMLLKASGTFWLYGLICIAGFFFIMKNLHETKGKTLEEIEVG